MSESTPPPQTPFEKSLEAASGPEERLRLALDHMRAAISQEGRPDFRTFWDTRKQCIDHFREGIHPAIRSQLWEEMRELTQEVRRLRDHLTKQAEFAAEQLELALRSLEEEIEGFDDAVASAPKLVLPVPNQRVQGRLGFYDPLQRQVTRLTNWATRINALRKELVRTDMRVSHKTKLFRRLSAVGDLVFPKRKELIQAISQAFVIDVEAFAGLLEKEPWPAPPFAMRDDIRALQAFAKTLTVTSKGFTAAREILSACWEKVRAKDEAFRREQQERRESFREVVEALSMRLAAINEQLNEGQLSDAQVMAAVDEVESSMRESDLGGRERKQLYHQMDAIRHVITERKAVASRERAARLKERAKASAEATETLIGKLEALMGRISDEGADEAQVEAAFAESANADLLAADRERLDRIEVRLRNQVAAATEERRLEESAGADGEGGILREILQARKERRAAIRAEVEALRRAAGSSGLDFEAAMATQQQLESEKARLSELDQQIDHIQHRLEALNP